ncbi:hypothetical protein GCM10011594_32950 [Nakamurella endophytica]|uniref:Uncharacterized protein n=1 Tax=Nakamurella endophytica TaxID=1748367 RepID=A0A917WJW8_9ACTN|nr:hypothetical protein GCM10011594_32950 [Nakamurella endophytica]
MPVAPSRRAAAPPGRSGLPGPSPRDRAVPRRLGDADPAAVRLARTAVFAATSTVTAAMGHALGGGGLPDPAVLVTAGLGVGTLTATAARGRRRWIETVALLAGAQLLFHVLFSLHHGHPAGHPAGLLAFHAVAALVTGVVLARGDAAAAALRRAGRAVVRALTAAPPVAIPGPSALPASRPAAAARTALLARCAPRRGPPAGARPLPA